MSLLEFQATWLWVKNRCPKRNPGKKWRWLKIKQEGQTAGLGPCFHLPGFHFGSHVFARFPEGELGDP